MHFNLFNARCGIFLKRKKFSLIPKFVRDDDNTENILFIYWLRKSHWVTWPKNPPNKAIQAELLSSDAPDGKVPPAPKANVTELEKPQSS